jgi:hypothetical protein
LADASVGDIIAQNLRNIGDGAAEAAPPVEELVDVLEGVDLSGFEAEVANLEASFNRLPSGLDAAREALRDDENEIVTDFTKFLDELEDELAAQAAFRADIDILRRLGLDNLADVFETEGLDSAAALADAVANPAEAQRANALLEAQAEDAAASYRQAFIAALESEDFTAAVRVRLIIDELNIDPTLPPTNEVVTGRPGPVSQQGSVTVVQNFDNTPSPTTETERAAQQINALLNVS